MNFTNHLAILGHICFQPSANLSHICWAFFLSAAWRIFCFRWFSSSGILRVRMIVYLRNFESMDINGSKVIAFLNHRVYPYYLLGITDHVPVCLYMLCLFVCSWWFSYFKFWYINANHSLGETVLVKLFKRASEQWPSQSQKGKDRLPTTTFQGCLLLKLWGCVFWRCSK